MENVQGWMDNFNRDPPRMWVMSPETTQASGWMAKQVTTYLVKLINNDIAFNANGIRKRYSEFEQLKAILDARYAPEGLFVPPLPPKNSMTTQDDSFLKSRAVGLSFFMENIAKSPFLMKDLTVEKFLTTGLDQADSDGVTVNIMNKNEKNATNTGYTKWIEYVNTFPECHDADIKINGLKAELDSLTKTIRDMMEKYKTVAQSAAVFQTNMKVLSTSFLNWKDNETSADYLNDVHPLPKNTVCDMAGALSNLASSSSISPSFVPQLDISFYERLQYELNCLIQLQSLLKKREDEFAVIYKHQSRIQRILGLSPQKQQEKAAELEGEKAAMQAHQEQYDRLTKGIVWVSVPLAARNRNENLSKASNNFSAVMASMNSASFNSCSDYFNIVKEVQSSAVNLLNEELCQLDIEPAPGVLESKYGSKINSTSNGSSSIVSGAGLVEENKFTPHQETNFESSILISAAYQNKEAIVNTVVENKDLLTVDNINTATNLAKQTNDIHQWDSKDPFSSYP